MTDTPFVAVSPTLGRPVTCYADVQAIRHRWLGDTPLPSPQLRVHAAERAWREEEARRSQLEADRQAAVLARLTEQLERRTA